MNKKYPCASCKILHRRGALVLIHKELLCRACLSKEYETMPPKKKVAYRLPKRLLGLKEKGVETQ